MKQKFLLHYKVWKGEGGGGGENWSLELKNVVTAVTELQIHTPLVASSYSALNASSHEGTEIVGTRTNSTYSNSLKYPVLKRSNKTYNKTVNTKS